MKIFRDTLTKVYPQNPHTKKKIKNWKKLTDNMASLLKMSAYLSERTRG